MVKCPLCGKEYRCYVSTEHLLQKHGFNNREEVEKLYPGNPLHTEEWLELAGRGGKRTSQHKNEDPEWADLVQKKIHTPQQRERQSEAHKNKSYATENSRKKQSEATLKLWSDPSYRKMQSEKTKKQHENGLTQRVLENSGKKRFPYKQYSMRSKWEVRFAELLDEMGLEWEFESKVFDYHHPDKNKIAKYYPDFFIKDLDLFIEIKPKSLINKVMSAKIQGVRELGRRITYITEDAEFNLDGLKKQLKDMPVATTQMLMLADFQGQQGWATSYAKTFLNSYMYVPGTINNLV